MNKTAIEILLEAYEKRGKEVSHSLLNCKDETEKCLWQADKIVNDMIVKDLKALLPTEQQQIEEAFAAARDDNGYGQGMAIIPYTYDDATDYFTQTYKDGK